MAVVDWCTGTGLRSLLFLSLSCLIINMLSEACYGILLHAFRRQSCRTRLNTDLRSDLSCSYTLVHKWFLDLPLDNGSRLRPSTEGVSVCPASMHPSALRRTREKNYWPRRSRYSSVANLMGTRWCDSCACVNLILRRTENLGEWSISLVREKTKLSFISQLVVTRPPGGGVLLGILGEGVPPGSPNPDPISDQKM